jgi:hypothetical protein
MKLSLKTKQRLIRYSKAVQGKETKVRTTYFWDGSSGESVDLAITQEWYRARTALKKCPEPSIKKLVYQIQWQRLDDGLKAIYDAVLADNELIALGHKFTK